MYKQIYAPENLESVDEVWKKRLIWNFLIFIILGLSIWGISNLILILGISIPIDTRLIKNLVNIFFILSIFVLLWYVFKFRSKKLMVDVFLTVIKSFREEEKLDNPKFFLALSRYIKNQRNKSILLVNTTDRDLNILLDIFYIELDDSKIVSILDKGDETVYTYRSFNLPFLFFCLVSENENRASGRGAIKKYFLIKA